MKTMLAIVISCFILAPILVPGGYGLWEKKVIIRGNIEVISPQLEPETNPILPPSPEALPEVPEKDAVVSETPSEDGAVISETSSQDDAAVSAGAVYR